MKKKYLFKKLKKRRFHKSKQKTINEKSKITKRKRRIIFIIKLMFFSLSILFIALISFDFNNNNNLYVDEYNIASDKWFVMTCSNPPTKSIINLENKMKKWKIVVIGNNKTIDSNWEIFKNSNKLIYLSIDAQNKLRYKILKYLNNDSYCRKNIGYLFAIQHGAKEIYELDENLQFSEQLSLLDININNSYISYGKQNNEKMINPYVHFGETNIWPRGFIIRDIMSDYNIINKTFYYAHSSKIKLKPLIYQGLINGIPDTDSLFLLTNNKKNKSLNISFSKNYPLLYLPENYAPINSKNTKYSYEIFPFLMLPITINESISDILRGYIIERFAFRYKGTIVFHNTNVYNDNIFLNNSNILKEKELFFRLNKILDIIKLYKASKYNSKKLLFKILHELIKNNFLKKEELKIYKSYFKDLKNIGYLFSSEFNENKKDNYIDYLNITSELIYYIPTNHIKLKGNNNFKLIKHSSLDKVYNDILLIINYNIPGYLKLNQYMEELYKKYFPNIAYIYPDDIEHNISNSNIISCERTDSGCLAYKCIKYIYNKFPNYKGYLLTNDDNFMKVWELNNLDFSIPWFYIYVENGLKKDDYFYKRCNKVFRICESKSEYKTNYIQFFGFYELFKGLSDLYYIPKNYINNFIELAQKMYEGNVFLECAVHAIFAIISAPKYQAIYIRPLWLHERKRAIKVLQSEFQQIFIHPIKFSNDKNKEEVNKYNYFINANEF